MAISAKESQHSLPDHRRTRRRRRGIGLSILPREAEDHTGVDMRIGEGGISIEKK